MGVSGQKFASVFDAFWFLLAIVIGRVNSPTAFSKHLDTLFF